MASTGEGKIQWDGPIIFIGFGSIGRGTLPLVFKHIACAPEQITIIDPSDANKDIADSYGVNFLKMSVTVENYKDVLGNLITDAGAQALIINVSVNVSSKDVIKFANTNNTLYIDTSIDPWAGIYFNEHLTNEEKSNYAFRDSLLELKGECAGGATAVSCCGANPGMVSWLLKQALINLAIDTGLTYTKPTTREEWALLMQTLGVKGVHIAERDTQVSKFEREVGTFLNTWSSEGCLSESLQPAELGWGTHEKQLPLNGKEHTYGCKSAIYIDTPAVGVHVQTWTPSTGHHHGFLITHNEAISISDYFSVKKDGVVVYRPTCHYAYRPTDATIASLNEVIRNNYKPQKRMHVLSSEEIESGMDELGVLLYGHKKNAYWYGSQLSIEEARQLAPHQNATGLQVTSAVITGLLWAIKNPNKGLVEAEEMDFEECLEIQKPYLGKVSGYYTDWNPLQSIAGEQKFKDEDDPWQFLNIRV